MISRLVGLVAIALALCVAPAIAQVDFSGEWAPRFWEDQPERVPGPDLGDYLGIPINDAARLRAEVVGRLHPDAARVAVPAALGRLHLARTVAACASRKKSIPSRARSSRSTPSGCAPSIAPIYLDGRPHPPADALHTWAGFSTAKWDGDILTVTVTHLKEGYLRRNGLPRSDKATLTEHWIRNGDFLTIVSIVNDPVYLTEPFIRTTDYELNLTQQVPPYPCGVVQEIDRTGRRGAALPAGHESLHHGVRDPARSAGRGHAWRRGHDVSGLQREAEDPAASKVGRSRSCPHRSSPRCLAPGCC